MRWVTFRGLRPSQAVACIGSWFSPRRWPHAAPLTSGVGSAPRCEPISAAQPFRPSSTAPRTGLLAFARRTARHLVHGRCRDGGSRLRGISDRALRPDHAGATMRAPRIASPSASSPAIPGDRRRGVRFSQTDRRHAGSARAPNAPYAAAGVAVRARDWNAAFAHYAAAARDFDRFAPRRAAVARHAMGELAYRVFNTNREAQLLAAQALRDFGPERRRGTAQRARSRWRRKPARLERWTRRRATSRARVRAAATTPSRRARLAKFGAREIPRLDILRGFMEYVADRPRHPPRTSSRPPQRLRSGEGLGMLRPRAAEPRGDGGGNAQLRLRAAGIRGCAANASTRASPPSWPRTSGATSAACRAPPA